MNGDAGVLSDDLRAGGEHCAAGGALVEPGELQEGGGGYIYINFIYAFIYIYISKQSGDMYNIS